MSIKLDGIEALEQWLSVTAPDLARQLAGDMVLDVAQAIASDAKARMPADTGKMKKKTKAKKDKATKTQQSASVLCGAFYWPFLENGDGPDGVEHAMFSKAQHRVEASLATAQFPRFKKRLAGAFSK